MLVGDSVTLCDDGHYARDGGTEDGNGRAFTSCNGLKGVREEVLDKIGVELEAIPGLRENCCKEGTWGGMGRPRRMVTGAQEDGGC